MLTPSDLMVKELYFTIYEGKNRHDLSWKQETIIKNLEFLTKEEHC